MTTVAQERTRPRSGLVGPVVLVVLGGILLLNNLGVLSWGIWDALLRLWPLLLIAVGLDLMIGRRSQLAAILIPMVLLLVAGVAVVSFGTWWGSTDAVTRDIHQPIAAVSSAVVELNGGSGELYLAAMETPDGLIAGTVRTAASVQLQPDFIERDGIAYYTLKTRDPVVTPISGLQRANERWDLRLNPTLPLQLTLNSGVGFTRLDLRELDITNLTIRSGVGELDVAMPENGRLTASIDSGVGGMRVVIPRDVAARITITRGLGDVQVTGDYVRNGDQYESAEYAQADNRIDLVIHGGVGGVVVIGE